ncbi:phosphonate metabolism protein/1,5-bisphosphokinase (PRPP-forming) PhnN [Crenobacter sp. SG2305]|uniref:phosphonate metabolism protein/1,5-bisphosphokinase (PRPP-forming) PhnN n=1 Tax=Crenobacter oryzisoli TaxID=3056844 RepID=UPI0025AA700D|nr:phosphonate metabolism protein/1,5-bisphosphokinase (PRPP-forming) PhnN [Crenobacter sp. SG2305]MDN0082848.1 phosphonate metabolism protein/1,5-bisphosphokinase (PRPP-forming) PhnN [Crenobacter sp. SG2305]
MTTKRGRLWYVLGPSGAGKDSVINYARERLGAEACVLFAHRYITRPADAGGENHVALRPDEFALRERAGLFVLTWHRNDLSYGIGIEVEQWLVRGLDVVVNGSRSALPLAERRFPRLIPLWIGASSEVLAQRLAARGRESEEQIHQRLAEAGAFSPPTNARVLLNDGELAEAGETLLAWLRGETAPH